VIFQPRVLLPNYIQVSNFQEAGLQKSTKYSKLVIFDSLRQLVKFSA